ncbi:nucleic-acid-binding protein from mobile element jockey [Elysia marginata]|uniref:Nucleic-acid-binding protein from mobile element jockey n=1 Tax=Elysia marginata TaxID=1093978 RepID=A0AAV4F713_9GAST|nr:nucleic-acid-binding protein from mobile element jockey [Elysia marginata]
MRYFRCHRYWHGRNKCRAKDELCVRCGEPGHGSEECKRDVRCVNCKGDHPANSKTCTKYMEEQAILRYRANNGGTFKQARAAVVINVAKEIRPQLFTQVVRGTSTRGVTTSATVKESVGVPSQVSTTARDGPGKKNVRMAESESSKRVRREKDRYGAESDVDINSIDSIWSIPEDLCSVGRGTGETSPPRPTPSKRSYPPRKSYPSQQSPPSKPPPRAPAPEDSDSGDMDTDLGSALSADPRGCPLSPLVLIQPKRPPSPGPVKAAGGKRYKGLAGPPSGGLPGKKSFSCRYDF